MSDKFAPKLTAKQRVQVEEVTKELLERIRASVFDGDAENSQELLKTEIPWASYLAHAVEDGKKDSPVRSPTKRASYAKKIKRSLKKTPTIADLQDTQPLATTLDDETIGALNRDLSNCCSQLPPTLWEHRTTMSSPRRKGGASRL